MKFNLQCYIYMFTRMPTKKLIFNLFFKCPSILMIVLSMVKIQYFYKLSGVAQQLVTSTLNVRSQVQTFFKWKFSSWMIITQEGKSLLGNDHGFFEKNRVPHGKWAQNKELGPFCSMEHISLGEHGCLRQWAQVPQKNMLFQRKWTLNRFLVIAQVQPKFS